MRPRHGRYTNAKHAQEIIARGHGLSEAEIEAFYARTEAIRQRHIDPKRVRNELRDMIEMRYGPKVYP